MAIRGVGAGGPVGGGRGSEQIIHTIQKGETLDGVAQQHGVSKKDLIKENPQLEGAAKLIAGMQLNIPAGRTGVAAAPAPAVDTFESAARRSFGDAFTGNVKFPNFGEATEPKYGPVTLKDETAAQRSQLGEAGDAGKLRPDEAGRLKSQSAEAQGHDLINSANLNKPIAPKTKKTKE